MNIKNYLAIVVVIGLFSAPAMANEEQEKIYLTQMLNQLDALQPLIIAADKEQSKNARAQFHYLAYRDTNGLNHNGLLEDINAIKKGIQAKLNNTGSEPRHFEAIKGDYLNLSRVVETHDVK